LSGTIDNVPLIAGVIPVILKLGQAGISITMVGSTANIVAIGLLEKRGHKSLSMREWVGLGLLVSFSTVLIAQIAVFVRTPYPF
jgi:Na+/H+ antiporter NhaD/arsenite permease-like protein